MSATRLNIRLAELLDRVDQRRDWHFLAILYVCRWIVLLPYTAIVRLVSGEVPAEDIELASLGITVLFVVMVIVGPLLETFVECTLPYSILRRLRKTALPPRPWGFVFASALIMVALHPYLIALYPTVVTGVFLAYCYAHFVVRGAIWAIAYTTAFHAAINIVGWTMLVVSALT